MVYSIVGKAAESSDEPSDGPKDPIDDFALVFKKGCDPQVVDSPSHAYLRHLRKKLGLVVKKSKHKNMYTVRASFEALLAEADRQRMRRETVSHSKQEFSLDLKREFLNVDDEHLFFTSGERLALMKSFFLNDPETMLRLSGTEVGKKRKSRKARKADVLISSIFPLHDEETVQKLLKSWIFTPLSSQPLDDVRGYFGEEIALYFGFLGSYTRWLVVPAVLGVALFLYQREVEGYDNLPTCAYAIFLSLWATNFFEFWKRREFKYAFRWEVHDASVFDEEREEYKRKSVLVFDEDTKTERYVYSPLKRMAAQAFSFVACLAEMCLAAACMVYFLNLANYAQEHWTTPEWSSDPLYRYAKHAPMIGYSFVLSTFSTLNKLLARKLTDMEVHRTEEDVKNAFVFKLVGLQFVNFYLALFYTAFAVNDLTKLHRRLAILLSFQQIVGQVVEVGVPLMKAAVRTASGLKNEESNIGESAFVQSKKESYGGVFGDYLELWVQFGQVTLFASIFPLAGLLALANNIVEIRSDGFKLLRASKRALPTTAASIGSWIDVFEFLGFVAVATNVALIGVSFSHSERGEELLSEFSPTQRVLLLVAVEHFVFVLKGAISNLIPNVPHDIALTLEAREELQREKNLAHFEVASKVRSKLQKSSSLDAALESMLPSTADAEVVDWLKNQQLARYRAEREKRAVRRELDYYKNKRSHGFKDELGSFALLLNVLLAGIMIVLVLSREVSAVLAG